MLVQGQVQNADYVVALHQVLGQHIQNVKIKAAFIKPLIIMMSNLQPQLSMFDKKIGLHQVRVARNQKLQKLHYRCRTHSSTNQIVRLRKFCAVCGFCILYGSIHFGYI